MSPQRTIPVRPNGNTASNVQLTVPLPASSALISYSGSQGQVFPSSSGNSLRGYFSAIAPGQVVTVNFSVLVIYDPGWVLPVTATVSADQADLETDNNSATAYLFTSTSGPD